jgi:hypothetical protein
MVSGSGFRRDQSEQHSMRGAARYNTNAVSAVLELDASLAAPVIGLILAWHCQVIANI